MIFSNNVCFLQELHDNQDQFDPSIASGVKDGIWWSFTTITTVG